MPEQEKDTMPALTGTPIPSDEEQLTALKRWISASDIFPKCRGQLSGWSAIDTLTRVRKAESPMLAFGTWSSLRTELEKQRSMEMPLIHKLFTLRKLGWQYAYEVLYKALTERRYVIPGEDLPKSRKTPGVLLIFDPKRTLSLLRWMSLLDPDSIKTHYDPSWDRAVFGKRSDLKGWTERMLDENPDFKKEFEIAAKREHGSLHQLNFFLPDKLFDEINDPRSKKIDLIQARALINGTSKYDFLANYRFGYFFPGKIQSDVLRCFDRDELNSVTTWQLYYPAHIGPYDSVKIGLFPENGFSALEKRYPSFCSPGASHGYKVMIIQDEETWDPAFRIESYRNDPEADPFKIGMTLHS